MNVQYVVEDLKGKTTWNHICELIEIALGKQLFVHYIQQNDWFWSRVYFGIVFSGLVSEAFS